MTIGKESGLVHRLHLFSLFVWQCALMIRFHFDFFNFFVSVALVCWVFGELLVNLEQLVLQLLLLRLMDVIHLIASVLRVVLDLLARLESVFPRFNHLLDLPQLLLNLFLSVAGHSIFPVGLLALPQRDRVDCVDGAGQENEPWYVHEEDFFEGARVPKID